MNGRVILITTILLIFLAGYAFGVWGAQFIDNIFTTITLWFQMIQGRMAVKITEDSVKAERIKKELGEGYSANKVIGFSIPDPDLEEEDEDEEYDD